MLQGVRHSRHEQVVVARGTLDKVVGVLRKQDLLDLHLDGKLLLDGDSNGSAALLTAVREPIVVHDGATVLQVLETFKNRPIQMALIVDEYGALRGVVTQTDLLEALAGDITDLTGELDVMKREDGSFLVDATMPVQEAFGQLGIEGIPDDGSEYRTLAGFVLWRLERIPTTGEHFEWEAAGDARRFEVVDMDGHRVDKVLVSKTGPKPAPASADAVPIARDAVKHLPSP